MRKKVDEDMYIIGSNIRAARMRADLTQEQLSESLGITPQFLSRIETGKEGVSVYTLKDLCSKLNISADFILFGNSNERNDPNSTIIEKIQRLPKNKADMVRMFVDAMEMDPEEQTYK